MKRILTITFLFITLCFYPQQNEKNIINEIDSLNFLAKNSFDQNDYASAYSLFNLSLRLSDSIKDNYGIAVSKLSIARIYSYMKKYPKAEEFFNASLKQSIIIDDNYLIANIYTLLSDLKSKTGKNNEAIINLEKALKYSTEDDVFDFNNDDKRESMLFDCHLKLADIYLSQGTLDKAHIFILRAKSNFKNLEDDKILNANFQFIYGKYFLKKLKYNLAISRFNETLNILEETDKNNTTNYKLLGEVYQALSNSYSEQEKYRKAYLVLLKYNKIKGKYLNEERIKHENIAKSEFFIADYQNAASLAKEQVRLQEKVAKKIKNVSYVTALAALILLILILILFKSFKSNLKINKLLKIRNEQLLMAKNQVEASFNLKSKFISNITHELRTPLYGIVGLSNLLTEGNNLSKKEFDYLESIKYSGNYLLDLVNNVLQLGKIESNKIELNNVNTDLRTTLRQIINSFENRLQETNNKLKLIIDESIPKYINCDRVRLTQILVNLIGNSIKFTQNGNINISVKVLQIKDGEIDLRFKVSDNGIGISKKDQKKIFENFTQLSSENNVNYQGSGLGLSIAQKLVELFGGKIELESILGKGSVFSFTLSMKLTKNNEREDSFATDDKSIAIVKNSNYKILIVEDNRINQIVTRNLLEKEKITCKVASDGIEALEALNKYDFDLILMDINMPNMGGNEATKRIRKFNTNIPIIALTASDIDEVKNNYSAIGYNDVIIKPFDNHKFFEIISKRILESKLLMNYEAYQQVSSI